MKGPFVYTLLAAISLILTLEGTTAQRHPPPKGKPTSAPTSVPDKTPFSIPFLVEPGVTSLGEIDKLVRHNSSLPFSLRFPKPERKSDKFHYPVLPSVYWSLHKKPEVPLVDPEEFEFTDL